MSEQTTTDRLVRYAEAMGWHIAEFPAPTEPPPLPRFNQWADGVEVQRCHGDTWRAWNPLTNPADAIELAEKLDIEFQRFRFGGYLAGEIKELEATLCAAICAAVDAALEKTT